MTNQKEMFTTMALGAWNFRVSQADKLFAALTDEQFQAEVSPGRNRGIYLLGHLTAVHDNMLPLLNFAESLYPALNKPFVESPDKAVAELPSVTDLKTYWTNVNAKLANHFNKMQPDEWLQKHTAVSDEDFIKEPHRNKLSILLSRTNHLSYHLGQLALLKK